MRVLGQKQRLEPAFLSLARANASTRIVYSVKCATTPYFITNSFSTPKIRSAPHLFPVCLY